MESLCCHALLAFVAIAALGRFTGIVASKLRRTRYARQAVAYPRSWRDLCTVPEPYLLAGTTLAPALGHGVPEPLPVEAPARAVAGAALALLAVVLVPWSSANA